MSEFSPVTPAVHIPSSPQCPICLRPIAKLHKCKTLYGVTVCNKCRNGFANRRQAAYLVDIVVLVLISQAFQIAAIRALAVASPTISRQLEMVTLLLLNWLAFPFLFTFKDALAGRSPGKMLLGVRVVDVHTRQPIAPLQSMKRNLVLMIPYVGVIGGTITMMRGKRWGDKWANTMVSWNKYAYRVPFATPGRYCRGCGYDLTGNTSGRCPECGMEIQSVPTPIPPAPAIVVQ